ncbi:hypothetical protein I6F14_23370 [Bradyrhizobium sp. IC3069]|uniref:hypothetical protein n=1 Tax=unclassified Bradyrhizobium TaxID=2631580 RepID=UPI001CD67963|nr:MULTISPECIES: hypothetical protein [unclassified Bradyrhizobium]MCA1363371.1 hypothetical protein [Bradyrhizobium sp. IC4059]MCA1520909.1 hypothetical protein [Bradyrhizobium sp. IC3069]
MRHLMPGIIRAVTMQSGDEVRDDFPLFFVQEAGVACGLATVVQTVDLDHMDDDLRKGIERQAPTLHESRPEAAARRHATGYNMPREDIARFVDSGSFNMYRPLIVVRQLQRHSIDELRRVAPANGVATHARNINAHLLNERWSRAELRPCDYMGGAGRRGRRNYHKQKPRPSKPYARVSGLVPMISVVNEVLRRRYGPRRPLGSVIATKRPTLVRRGGDDRARLRVDEKPGSQRQRGMAPTACSHGFRQTFQHRFP